MYPYVNWASDFPTGSGHCVSVDTNTWEWTDASCDEEATFICEFGNYDFTYKILKNKYLMNIFKERVHQLSTCL